MDLFDVTGIWMLAIGKTILHSIWIGMLILALLRLALAYIPASLSGLRYSISVASLLFLFFSVITAFAFIYQPASSGQDILSWQNMIPAGTGNTLFYREEAPSNAFGLLFTLLGYIYLAGVLFMLFRSAKSLAQIRVLQKSSNSPATEWQERFSNLCNSLGISRSVAFLESKLVTAPQLATFLKPAVIVPAGMLTNLPVSQVETILIHELYHLKRKDYLVNLLQLFIEGVLFYHPAVWLISDNIRNEREHCCDDRVLRSTDNPVLYAKALIQVAEQEHFSRLSPGAAGSGKHQFYSRIKRILNQHTMKTNMRDKVLTLTLLAGSLILLLTISGFISAPAFIKINELYTESMAEPIQPFEASIQDTIPEKSEEEKPEEADLEAIMEELEEAREEALAEIEEIDWESIKEEMEEAREEALKEIEEIDWESIKEEMEEARVEALEEIEEIDWEAIKEEMEAAREEALKEIEEIDWDAIRKDMEAAREEALKEIEEIDWEALREEMEQSYSEMKVDMEELKIELENSMKDIDWEKIREDIEIDLEEARIYLDSIKIEMDL